MNVPDETPCFQLPVCQSLRLKQISPSLAELYLCLLSVLDIRKQDVPVKDTTFYVPAWEAAYLEPSIYSVDSADAASTTNSRSRNGIRVWADFLGEPFAVVGQSGFGGSVTQGSFE